MPVLASLLIKYVDILLHMDLLGINIFHQGNNAFVSSDPEPPIINILFG